MVASSSTIRMRGAGAREGMGAGLTKRNSSASNQSNGRSCTVHMQDSLPTIDKIAISGQLIKLSIIRQDELDRNLRLRALLVATPRARATLRPGSLKLPAIPRRGAEIAG